MRSRFGALAQPNFRRFWIGQTTSAAGDGLTGVALTFAVLAISGSATDLGIVFAAFLIPRVAFLLVGGVWADRLPRRYVMIAADLIRAAAQLMIAAAVFSQTQALWPFVVAAAISGAASAFFTPAASASFRRQSPRIGCRTPTRCWACRSGRLGLAVR